MYDKIKPGVNLGLPLEDLQGRVSNLILGVTVADRGGRVAVLAGGGGGAGAVGKVGAVVAGEE